MARALRITASIPVDTTWIEVGLGQSTSRVAATLASRFVAEGRATVDQLLLLDLSPTGTSDLAVLLRQRMCHTIAALQHGLPQGAADEPAASLLDTVSAELHRRRLRLQRAVESLDSIALVRNEDLGPLILRAAGAATAPNPVRERPTAEVLSEILGGLVQPGSTGLQRLRRRWRIILVDHGEHLDRATWAVLNTAFGNTTTMLILTEGDVRDSGNETLIDEARAMVDEHVTLVGLRSHPNQRMAEAIAALSEAERRGQLAPSVLAPTAPAATDPPLRLRVCPQLPQPALGQESARADHASQRRVLDDLAADVAALICGDGRAARDPWQVGVVVSPADADAVVRSLSGHGVPVEQVDYGDVLHTAAAADWSCLLHAVVGNVAAAGPQLGRLRATLGLAGAATPLTAAQRAGVIAAVRDVADEWRSRGIGSVAETVLRRRMGQVTPRHLTDLRHVADLLHRAEQGSMLSPLGLIQWLEPERSRESAVLGRDRSRRLVAPGEVVRVAPMTGIQEGDFSVLYVVPRLSGGDLSDSGVAHALLQAMSRARDQVATWAFHSASAVDSLWLLLGQAPWVAADDEGTTVLERWRDRGLLEWARVVAPDRPPASDPPVPARSSDEHVDSRPLDAFPDRPGLGAGLRQVLLEADPAEPDLDAEIARHVAARQWPYPVDAVELAAALGQVMRTPLGDMAGNVRLCDIAFDDRLSGMSYLLPGSGEEAAGPDELARLAQAARATLDPQHAIARWAVRVLADPHVARVPWRRYLTGSSDLVFRYQARWYVVDFRTEPGKRGHYRLAELTDAFVRSDAPLAALMKCISLHRYLRWRQQGYSPSRHLGGYLGLHVRGMRPVPPARPDSLDGVIASTMPAEFVESASNLLHDSVIARDRMRPVQGRVGPLTSR